MTAPLPHPTPTETDATGLLTAAPLRTAADVNATWLRTEALLLPGRYCGTEPADSLYRLPATTRPDVLVTAPHAVVHHRPERRKGADVASGGMALSVAALLGAHGVIAAGEQTEDGNRSAAGTFKAAVNGHLRSGTAVLFDVHGMADSCGSDVCLGTGADEAGTRALYEPLREHLTAAGLTVAVNDPWGATHEHSLTNTAHRAGVFAVQLEVAARWRQPWDAPDDTGAFVLTLADAMRKSLASVT